MDDQYYTFSSVFFYTNRRALLLNGRVNNLEYGSYAPDAPQVFIDDAKLKELWPSAARYYLVAEKPAVKRYRLRCGRKRAAHRGGIGRKVSSLQIMQICIDATSLLLRSAGVKNYVYHWMRSLQAEAKEHVFSAYPLLGHIGDLNHEASVLSPMQTIPRLALLHLMNLRFNPGIDYLMAGIDVFHASNQVRNPPKRTRLTGTLYDMTCLLMPQNHTSGNVSAEQNFADKVLSRADGLIAISNNTKVDAVKLLGLNPDRIEVIYPGVPAVVLPCEARRYNPGCASL